MACNVRPCSAQRQARQQTKLHDELTPGNKVIVEKLVVPQRVKQISHFLESGYLLPFSKGPAVFSYPERDKYGPTFPTLISSRSILILSFIFQLVSFPQVSLPKP